MGDATRAKSRKELEERFRARMSAFNPDGKRLKSDKKQKRIAIKMQKAEKLKERKRLGKKIQKQRTKTRKKEASNATSEKKVKKEAGGGGPQVEKKPAITQDETITFSKFDFSVSAGARAFLSI